MFSNGRVRSDERFLELGGRDSAEVAVEIRHALEVRLVEPRPNALEDVGRRRYRMPLVMLAPPLRRRSRRLVPGREQRSALALVPVGRRLVELLPAELVEHERSAVEDPGDMREVEVEVLAHVVERAARDDGVEARSVLELLELDPPEDRAVRRARVDRRDLVPGRLERERELTLSTPDLEHSRRRRRQMR